MPLDPGGGYVSHYPTSNARSIRRNPQTGQTAYVPYESGYRGSPSWMARFGSGLLQTANPVSAIERFTSAYSASQKAGDRLKKLSPADQDAYLRQSVGKPRSWIEGLGLPNPQTPEEWGAVPLELIPVRMKGGSRYIGTWGGKERMIDPNLKHVDVNTVEGPTITDRALSFDDIERQLAVGEKYLTHLGGEDRLGYGEKATVGKDPSTGIPVASAQWLADPDLSFMNAGEMYIHPALRGNAHLFRALVNPMLQEARSQGTPLHTNFANPDLMRLADRYFERMGWQGNRGFLGGEREYIPPSSERFQVPSAFRRRWNAGELY